MRILVCCGGYNSFNENKVTIFALDQAKALRDYGHDVRICAGDMRSIRRIRPWGRWQYELDGIKVYTANFPCGPLPNFIFRPLSRWVAKRCYELATQDGWVPDIVHAHFLDAGIDYLDLAHDDEIPFVLTEHYSSVLDCNVTQKTSSLIKNLYPNVDCLLTVSIALANSIKKYSSVIPLIVPNIVDTKLFNKKHSNNEKTFRLLCCATLIKSKGQDVLIKALRRLAACNVELLIMGDGPERRALERLAEKLGIRNKVKFTGYYKREEMAEELAKADAFVLPSRFETFGVVYIEAMAAGVPVIATDCGGPRDFVNDKVGVLVPVDDVDALAAAMQDMVDGKVKYDAAAIAQYARDNFSPEVIAAELTRVYEDVLENR